MDRFGLRKDPLGRIQSLGKFRNKEIFCVGWVMLLSVQGCRKQLFGEHCPPAKVSVGG